MVKTYTSFEKSHIEKSIGKPYSQQPGRKAGKGAGHITIQTEVTIHPSKKQSDVIGTAFQGYLDNSYKNLVKKLGKPHSQLSDNKIQCQWAFDTPHGVMTIYDYKQYNAAPNDITEWHVGGKSEDVMKIAEALFPGKTSVGYEKNKLYSAGERE